MTGLEWTVADLADKVERRVYGKYRGSVVDNQDPARLGRLRVSVPGLLNDVVTGWATPCAPYGGAADEGFFFIPERGAQVWVEFEGGDLEFPIWTGGHWIEQGFASQALRPGGDDGSPADAVQERPTCKILRTRAGHTIQFEDAAGTEAILLREGGKGHLVRLDAEGIHLTDATGNSIAMTATGVTLTAATPLTIDATGQPVTIKASTIDLQKAS